MSGRGLAPTDVAYFESAAAFRAWLDANHPTVQALWVGFYKKATGRPGITYREAVDEALCFGWIDGLTRRVDEASYAVRFTPRRPGSNWSLVNVKRIGELSVLGRMQPAGLHAFDRRDRSKAPVHANDERFQQLGESYEQQFRANPAAWAFFEAQPPGYRRLASAWVMHPKSEAARQRRLTALIEDSAAGRRSTWTVKRPPESNV